MMSANETATAEPAVGPPTSDDVAGTAPVLGVMWCGSVGTSWTLEHHELDDGTAPRKIMDWVGSGVPISQPEPDVLARQLFAERGLQLFRDPSSAGPGPGPGSRLGYVCRDAELIALAHLVQEDATRAGVHPVALAAQWVAAGFSADVAAGLIRRGIHTPHADHQQTGVTAPFGPLPMISSRLVASRPVSAERTATATAASGHGLLEPRAVTNAETERLTRLVERRRCGFRNVENQHRRIQIRRRH